MIRRYGESKAHEKAKERIGQILREKGFNVWVDSLEFKCKTEKGERTYWPDVYAENFSLLNMAASIRYDRYPVSRGSIQQQNRGRRIIVEVQGFKGHKSKAAFFSDRARLRDIWESYGQIQHFEVRLGRQRNRGGSMDIRNWSDADILEHLEIS